MVWRQRYPPDSRRIARSMAHRQRSLGPGRLVLLVESGLGDGRRFPETPLTPCSGDFLASTQRLSSSGLMAASWAPSRLATSSSGARPSRYGACSASYSPELEEPQRPTLSRVRCIAWFSIAPYRPMITSMPEKMASIYRFGTFPTRSASCRLSMVTICDTFATESRSRPVCRV